MSFVQDEEMIQALAADRSDHPLHEGVLPGGAWGGEDLAVPCPGLAVRSPRRRSSPDHEAGTWADSSGNASIICWIVQIVVG